jgi:hypothetical protein
MAGLFSRLSQRVLAPEGNVKPIAPHRVTDVALPAVLPDDALVESFALPRAPTIPGSTAARKASTLGREPGAPEASSARSPAQATPERVAVVESAAMDPPLPRRLLSAQIPVKPVPPGLECEDFLPRPVAASPDSPADAERQFVRAAPDIAPRMFGSVLPARCGARETVSARAIEQSAESPSIHVTIDRIEVHQPPVPAPAPRAPPASSARISLSDYLSGARRRP